MGEKRWTHRSESSDYVEIEIPDGQGGMIRKRVSPAWLRQMEREGRAKKLQQVVVHICGSSDFREETWTVGQEVTQEQYDAFVDKEQDVLYVMEFYDQGV